MNSHSGTTYTTMTSLETHEESTSSIEGSSTLNGTDGYSNATSSLSSRGSGNSGAEYMHQISHQSGSESAENSANGGFRIYKIYNYFRGEFVEYRCSEAAICEDVCIDFSRTLNICPTTRLLFGIRVYDSNNEWITPGERLKSKTRYCFRMRFKVPALDTQLHILDPHAYEYLYRQMRHDIIRENIPEIRYPNKKDNVVGLGVVDMYIDELEGCDKEDRIISNYKRYLPRSLIKAHKVFVKPKICNSYRQFRRKNIDLAWLKWNYVHEVHDLAPSYLSELYTANVDYIPGDEADALLNGENMQNPDDMGVHVYVKIDLNETDEPSLKVARIAAEDKRKWMLIGTLNNIYALLVESNKIARLEVLGFPNAYRMKFEHECDLKSFITYLGGYIRLTCKWMSDLCCQYKTPSLTFLNEQRIHGPIGGNFSYAKIREKRDECGRFLIRQCEKEYDIFYIDINTRIVNDGEDTKRKCCKTETFKISKDSSTSSWVLHINDNLLPFDNPVDLAKAIPADTEVRTRIRPSEYDQPPNLLICLSKKLQSQKTDLELTEAQLQHKRAQIFHPKIDLQWYKNSTRNCDNGKMFQLRAIWIQEQKFKDITVTLKVLKDRSCFQDFMNLANSWSKVYSNHFLKLYGLTLTTPHTMVMEFAPYGPLNHFLSRLQDKAPINMLLDIVYDLIRSIVYLRQINMVHGKIRCANLYVTKFNAQTNFLVAKLGDPGLSRSYSVSEDLPWIPFEYYSNLDGVRKDHNAEAWAFATTVWEIFARGRAIPKHTPEQFNQEYFRTGAILEKPSDDCPEEMYDTMMDGWSRDPEPRFNFQVFLSRINELKNSNYSSISEPIPIPTTSLLELPNENQNGRIEEFEGFVDDDECITSVGMSYMGKRHNYFSKINSVLDTPFGKLIWKKVIGEGHYGIVSMGEIQYNGPGQRREKVAIKELKAETNKSISKDFVREIKIMQELDHPNIVKIKQWTSKPICIIMEYLEGGSFLIYLKTKAPGLTTEKLLRFALDIAKGMEYLGSKSILHRDLAARNILVDHEHVKISDFGLAQIADANGYYVARSKREIPYKWYSPDALSTEKYSFQTDVWSYGVTLYEMFSRGETPNLVPIEANETQFLNRLEKGERLPKPPLCPDIVYTKLMLRCWNGMPKNRPTFTELKDEIQSIIDKDGEEV